MLINVSFTFEAETIEEAQEIVATWTVTPGAQLLGLSGTVQGVQRPVRVAMGGTIGSAMRAAQRAFIDDMPSAPVTPRGVEPAVPFVQPSPRETTVFPPPTPGNGNGD